MSEQQIIGAVKFDPAIPSHIAWFCIRSQQKHENIAARHLAQMEDVAVFNPRIRFARSTKQGPVWVTESLFPNYLFARFDWQNSLARVYYAPGVKHVVHFGLKWPTVPDEVIEELRAHLGAQDLQIIPMDLQPGDRVKVSGGVFHGLKALVTQVLPARERVGVLMHFLGQQTMVEVSINSVVREKVRA